MYELAGGLVAASVVFYLLRGASLKQTASRLPFDAVTAYLALTYVKEHTLPRAVRNTEDAIDHAREIIDQGFTLLAGTAFPFGQPSRNIVCALIFATLAAGVVAWRVLPAGDAMRRDIRRWLVTAATGAVVVLAGYVTLAPATYGAPLDVGIENRVNMVAAFGYIAIVYAAAMIAGHLLIGAWRRRPAHAPALALGLSALIAIGYLARLDADKERYAAAYNEGQRVLDGISRATNDNPKGASVIFVFGSPAFTAPGVPVFAWIWDLTPAVKVHFRDPSLAAFPILPGTVFKCESDRMFPESGYGTGPGESAAYKWTYFVDARTGTGQMIDSPEECESAQQRFKPGPLVEGSECALWGGGPATRLAWHCARKPEV
jgi:hypothetical protein